MNRRPEAIAIDAAAVTFAAAIVIGFYFRTFFRSSGALLYGDSIDASVTNNFHEQLFQAVAHHRSIRDLPFFFPAHDVLGYASAYVLDLPIYALLRISGLDPFYSFEWLLIALMALGTGSFFLIFRALLRVQSPVLAAALAVIAAVPNNAINETFGNAHTEPLAALFLPVAVLLTASPFVRREWFDGRPYLAYACVGAGGLVAGLTLSTTFYLAWFAALYAIIVTVFYAIFRRKIPLPSLSLIAAWLIPFALAICLFGYIYIDAFDSVGGRDIGEYLVYAPSFSDIFDVGPENLLWGHLVRSVIPIVGFDQGGRLLAITPVLWLGIFACAVYWWFKSQSPRRAFVLALVAAVGAVFILTIHVGRFTPFEYVRLIVPGATAIRVGMRGQIVGSAVAALAIGITIVDAFERWPARKWLTGLICGGVALILFEQVNLVDVHWRHHSDAMALFRGTPAPPPDCVVTYFSGRQAGANVALRAEWEIEAMWRAVGLGVPTIDGYSASTPPGWQFVAVDDLHLDQAVREWISANAVRGLCIYDVPLGLWRNADR